MKLHMPDRIEKQIEIKAPVSRVWRALTDHHEFGQWFQVKIDLPFQPGKESTGHITYPGFEHVEWHATVKEMQPEKLFSFTWHPYGIDKNIDYSTEEPTLVEFRLEPTANGTKLTLTESGFDRIPEHRREEAFRMNEGGWSEQMKNIEAHVSKG